MKRIKQEKVDFERTVKTEKLSEDEDESKNFNVPILLPRCFVNLHNGTNLNDITKCPKCPRTSSKNLASLKKEKLHEDQSFLLKVNDIKSFREKFQQNKNEICKVKTAPVSRVKCITIIEISSDSEEDCKTNSVLRTNVGNVSALHEKKVEAFDKKIVKTEIKQENFEDLDKYSLLNSLSFCKKEEIEIPDTSVFEPSINNELVDTNLHSPTINLFHTGKNLEINSSIKRIKKNIDVDAVKKDVLFLNGETPIFEPEVEEEFVSKEKSESMKKLEILRRYCETFECEHCGKSFTTKVIWKAHVKVVHEGEKPFKCKLCEKSFKYSVCRRRHYFKYHKNMKSYKCVTCGKQFLTYGWYRRHKCRDA